MSPIHSNVIGYKSCITLVQQSGKYSNVGFSKEDLHIRVVADHKVHMRDCNVERVLAYSYAKVRINPLLHYQYSGDEDISLSKLIWDN